MKIYAVGCSMVMVVAIDLIKQIQTRSKVIKVSSGMNTKEWRQGQCQDWILDLSLPIHYHYPNPEKLTCTLWWEVPRWPPRILTVWCSQFLCTSPLILNPDWPEYLREYCGGDMAAPVLVSWRSHPPSRPQQ